jgi:hypothetical protein
MLFLSSRSHFIAFFTISAIAQFGDMKLGNVVEHINLAPVSVDNHSARHVHNKPANASALLRRDLADAAPTPRSSPSSGPSLPAVLLAVGSRSDPDSTARSRDPGRTMAGAAPDAAPAPRPGLPRPGSPSPPPKSVVFAAMSSPA